MRILFLLNSELRQEQRIGKEIASLEGAGFEVFLVETPKRKDTPKSEALPLLKCLKLNLFTRRLPKNLFFWPLKYAEMVTRMLLLSLRLKPRVIHCVDRLTLLPGVLAGRLIGCGVIYDSQELHFELSGATNTPRWMWLALERFLTRYCHYVIVTDHFRKEITKKTLRLRDDKTVSILNVPFSKFKACERNLRRETGWPTEKIVIYAGAISPGRHYEESIQALTLIEQEVKMVFVGFGDPEYINNLESLVQFHKLSSRVKILPPVKWNEITSFIRDASCALAFYQQNSVNNYYCSPSKLFDALHAGLPVIGTDNPLIREVLAELKAGVCIKSVNQRSIANAIMEVIQDEYSSRKDEISVKAKMLYSWESEAVKLIEIYSNEMHCC